MVFMAQGFGFTAEDVQSICERWMSAGYDQREAIGLTRASLGALAVAG